MKTEEMMLVRQVMLAFSTAAKDTTGINWVSRLCLVVRAKETPRSIELTSSGLMTAVSVMGGDMDKIKMPPITGAPN